MSIGKSVELLRTGDLVLHCVDVQIFQKVESGLKMFGHGTFKVNDVGTIYMEFICTSSENVPQVVFGKKLPEDSLDEEKKLYLRAQVLNGDIYESEGFSIEINMNSSNPPSRHVLFLPSIQSKSIDDDNHSTEHNFLYVEFSEPFNIPANKSNSVVSSLGSKSHSYNQTLLDMGRYEISMIRHEDYTEARIHGDFEPEELMDCLKFYIGFSSASIPQFLYVIKRVGNVKKEVISSISNKQRYQRSSSPMTEIVADEKYRGSTYHYNLLSTIIELYRNNPKHFESLYSQWERVWHSFQSRNSIMILSLTVAIEGLLNDIFIPAIKEQIDNFALESEIEEIKKKIKTLELTGEQRSRILGSVSYWKNITASKALDFLIEKCVITKEDKKIWQELRNESAHPKVREINSAAEQLERERVFSCLNLFHKLMLNALSFTGPMLIFRPGKSPVCVELIHKDIL